MRVTALRRDQAKGDNRARCGENCAGNHDDAEAGEKRTINRVPQKGACFERDICWKVDCREFAALLFERSSRRSWQRLRIQRAAVSLQHGNTENSDGKQACYPG